MNKILILGASGMAGSMMLRVMSENSAWREVVGSVRNEQAKATFPAALAGRLGRRFRSHQSRSPVGLVRQCET